MKMIFNFWNYGSENVIFIFAYDLPMLDRSVRRHLEIFFMYRYHKSVFEYAQTEPKSMFPNIEGHSNVKMYSSYFDMGSYLFT